MRLKSITPIAPVPSRCIEVAAEDRLFAAGGASGEAVLSHNSVVQRNIILGCILRPERWRFLGIDLKKVELSAFRAYSNVVLGIATTLEDALTVLRFAQETMMKRYAEMEQLGVNNFLDLPEKGQALMVMVDEAGELLSPSGVKSEQGKADDALKGEASMIIGSIARLGRAAGVHLIIATQRPDASILPGETKANLGVRINCGRTMGSASQMILENGEGQRVKANPRGRLYLKIYGHGDHGQGFWAEQSWIDEYLAGKGLNPDGTPLTGKRSKLANITDISEFEGVDLDAREGVDNAGAIERIREEEADDAFADFMPADGDDDDDWGFDTPEASSEDEDADAPFDDGDEEEEEEAPPPPTDRPLLTNGKTDDDDPWHRPEDDWDMELEDLIRENNEK